MAEAPVRACCAHPDLGVPCPNEPLYSVKLKHSVDPSDTWHPTCHAHLREWEALGCVVAKEPYNEALFAPPRHAVVVERANGRGFVKPGPFPAPVPACRYCGSPSLQPAGTCSVCPNCGSTSGCS